MKTLITGAGGYIGSLLVEQLISKGEQVNILVRTKKGLPDNYRKRQDQIRIIEGDISDRQVVYEAMTGCDRVYHLAAYCKPSENPDPFYKINVTGSINVFDAAVKHNVKKVVLTSTAGTCGPQLNGKPIDESFVQDSKLRTVYEDSKLSAERWAQDYVSRGLNITIVAPTRVFGPGKRSKSNIATLMLEKYLQGKWRFVPGHGKYIGNYVYVNDVVDAHMQAMEKGIAGEKYLIGGHNLNFHDFFDIATELSGIKYRLMKMPPAMMFSLSAGMAIYAKIVQRPPMITTKWVKKYLNNYAVTSQKAEEDLGYTPTDFKISMKQTIDWLSSAK